MIFLLMFIATAQAAPVLAPITIECDRSCPSYIKAVLPAQLAELRVNVMSNCFRDYFKKQKTILETKLTADQVVDKLTTTPVKIKLSVYSVPWYKRAFHPECGFENGDNAIHLKETCYGVMTNTSRESFYLHEISHSLGFTHYTAGNKSAGNEQTIPYLVNAAYESCNK